jgi:hypothetical protein
VLGWSLGWTPTILDKVFRHFSQPLQANTRLLIFPTKNFSEHLVKGAPPGMIFHCLPSGWISAEV